MSFQRHLIIFLISFKIFHSATIGNYTQVTPQCGSQLISIEINFDSRHLPGGRFTDWIIVGVSGRPECRLKGNGETKYIIEIAVFNDPCLTEIPAQNVFQNRVRIGKNPVVILQEDQSVIVKCVYGLPTVETMSLPIITSNFNIENRDKTETNKELPDQSLSQPLPSPRFGHMTEELNHRTTVDANSDFLQPETNIIDMAQPRVPLKQVTSTLSSIQFNANNEFSIQDNNFEKNHESSKTSLSSNSLQVTDTNPENPKKSSFPISFLAGVILFLLVASTVLCCCIIIFGKKKQVRSNLLLNKSNLDLMQKKNMPQTESHIAIRNVEKPQLRQSSQLGRARTSTKINLGNSSVHANTFNQTPHVASFANQRSGNNFSEAPLKSNLEEFVSKTYALGEYNSLASPAYAYSSEIFEEREIDVNNVKPETIDEAAVSSFKSITEIIHSAETASTIDEGYSKFAGNDKSESLLTNCVHSIRGYGHKKLTEQEIIRWKNLIRQDARLTTMLLSAKSLAEIERIFETDQYTNIFTASKWHEISICVQKALTNSLERTNSQCELQVFVGNVNTDW